MDGYETAKLIRQRSETERTPIIFVSAFGRDDMQTSAAYASGAVDFIFTPILPEVLRAKVSALVGLFLQAQALQRSVESITTLNVALRDSEVRARAVLQNVADGIVTAGEDGLIESFNRVRPAAVRLPRGGGHRPAARADRRAEPSRRLLRVRARPLGAAERRRRPRRTDRDAGLPQGRLVLPDGDGHEPDADRRRHVHDRLRARHLRAQGLHRGARAPRAARRGHRAPEPRAVRRPHRPVDRAGRALRRDRAACSCSTSTASARSTTRYGREVGDVVLQAVAERLRGTVRDADTVARLDGDSFGVLPAGETDIETAAAVAWKPAQRVRAPVPRRRARHRRSGELRDRLLPAARPHDRRPAAPGRPGAAPGQVLGQPASPCSAAEPEDQTERRLSLLSELRDGIPRGELVLHYQPKVELRRTMRIVGVEALVRWQHPTRGLLMPDQFMPEADRSALIEPLTKWVLDEALRQQSAWSERGIDLTMAVNISARQPHARQRPPDDRRRAHRGVGHHARPADPRAHRERADRRRRARRPGRSCTRWASGWRSTTSAPATRRSSTCSSCRSTRSRSTARSSRTSRRRRTTP